MPSEPKAADTVAVYNFRDLAHGFESADLSRFKATRQAIVDIFQGDLVDATEQWVCADELDELGRYRRLPTGWGEFGPC